VREIATSGFAGTPAITDLNEASQAEGSTPARRAGQREIIKLLIKYGNMEREQKKNDLIGFLRTIQRPDYFHDEIDEDSSLIESGLIDSLALLQIVTYLEQTYDIDFRETGIDPADLRSVGSILNLIDRELKS
jgi:acyl carrier protein